MNPLEKQQHKDFEEKPHSKGPPKIAPSHRRTRPPPNTWFLESNPVHALNGILIGLAVLAQLKVMSNGQAQIHRPWNSGNNRQHLCTPCSLMIVMLSSLNEANSLTCDWTAAVHSTIFLYHRSIRLQ